MRIGIVTDVFESELKAGIYYQWHNLVNELISTDKKNEYILIHSQKSDDPIYNKAEEMILPGNKIVKNIVTLGKVIKRRKIDLLVTNRMINLMRKLPCRTILFVHDISPILLPKTHIAKNVLMQKLLITLAGKNADSIVAVSENTKKDLVNHLNMSANKIHVIYNACGIVFARKEGKCSIKIPKNFILSVSTLEPRKNLVSTIKAFEILKTEGFKEKLVIAGAPGWKYQPIMQLVKELGMSKDVVFAGHVDEKELVWLYNHANVFVYPSLYEGFGMPVLEAMSCGCPVVTSNVSSIPEVVGDAAIMVHPTDVVALAGAISQVLKSKTLSKSMSKKGLIQSKKFSWEIAAKQLLKIMERMK